MKEKLKNLNTFLLLIPVVIYYALESLFLAMFLNLIWKYLLFDMFLTNLNVRFEISYPQFFGILLTARILFFDIFKISEFFLNQNNEKQKLND